MGRRSKKVKGRGLLPYQSMAPAGTNEQFSAIALSMRMSPAWHALKRGQRGLYGELTACLRFDRNGKPPERTPRYDYPERLDFALPWVIYYSQALAKASGAYSDPITGAFNNTAFRDDMKTLQALGFIDLLLKGKNVRKPNVYKLSERWKNYKDEDAQRILEALSEEKKKVKRLRAERKRHALPTSTTPMPALEIQKLSKVTTPTPPTIEEWKRHRVNTLAEKEMEGFTMQEIERMAKDIAYQFNRRTDGRTMEWTDKRILLDAVAALKEQKKAAWR